MVILNLCSGLGKVFSKELSCDTDAALKRACVITASPRSPEPGRFRLRSVRDRRHAIRRTVEKPALGDHLEGKLRIAQHVAASPNSSDVVRSA